MTLIEQLRALDLNSIHQERKHVSREQVIKALAVEYPGINEFIAFLSPVASQCLEDMAQRAHEKSVRQFGRTVALYTPLYLGNYCENQCVYCGFNTTSSTKRHVLTPERVASELNAIHDTGLRDVLLLTGESRKHTSLDYLEGVVKGARTKFKSVGIEIYPLESDEYKRLVDAGVNSLTIYQETYNESVYDKVHVKGPKKDFVNRLNAPERACIAGMPQVSIGALFGLSDPLDDAIKLFYHMKYLEKHYPHVELSMSLPRLRSIGGTLPFGEQAVDDKLFVQLILAFRLSFPRLGMNLSTRESGALREHLLPLGITKMSAGVKTTVGGHSQDEDSDVQFDISDNRSVKEMEAMLKTKGFQAIYSDWVKV